MRAIFAALLLGALGACSIDEPWETKLDAGHPLVGRIWDVKAASFVDADAISRRLGAADIILLGEKHDNGDHQRLAARLVDEIAGHSPLRAVGFEILSADKQPALDAGGADFGRSFAPYARIAATARGQGVGIVALNAPDMLVRDTRLRGLSALDAALIKRLTLDRPIDSPTETAIAKDMRDSHCGMLPESAIPGMVAVQRLWDAHMADRGIEAAGPAGRAILMVGANHARNDRGVPAAIERMSVSRRKLSLAFIEVAAGRDKPADYAKNFDVAALPFDFVWFTPRASAADPCAAFRRRTG